MSKEIYISLNLITIIKHSLKKHLPYFLLITTITAHRGYSQVTSGQEKIIDSLFSGWNHQQGPGSSSPDGYQQILQPQQACDFTVKDISIDLYSFQGDMVTFKSRAYKELFHRISKISPSTDQLKVRAGSYFSEELGVSYHFFEKDGTLYLKFFELYDVPLTPYAGDLFAGEFLGTNLIRFVQDEAGKIWGMEFNREGIHQLAFRHE